MSGSKDETRSELPANRCYPGVWKVGQAIIKIRSTVTSDRVVDLHGAPIRRQTDRAYFANGQIYERTKIERKHVREPEWVAWHYVRDWIKAPPSPDAVEAAGWIVTAYNPNAQTAKEMRKRNLVKNHGYTPDEAAEKEP